MIGRPVAGHSTRTRLYAAVGVATVILAGLIWAVAASRKNADAKFAAAGGSMAGMPGMSGGSGAMEGMAGMSATANGGIQVSASQIRQFGITFDTAKLRPLTSEVRTAGVVTFNETTMAQVAPKFGGFVEKLYVNFTGQQVRRGQPLLDIYSPELVAAQQELLLAGQLQSDMGKSNVPGVPSASGGLVDAAKRRLRLWDIPENQIAGILRSGRVRRALTLYAPVSGVVVEKKVLQGQATSPGEQLYTIANLSDVWVDIELREVDAGTVRVGATADIEMAGIPGKTFTGRVAYVYPTLQPETRTVKARVAVPNPTGLLKPGMYATVRLRTPGGSALTVPNSALLRTGDSTVVFIALGGGELMPRGVTTGRTVADYTEILSGLQPGQRVVTSAQFLISSESNLGEVMKGMIGNMGSGDKAMQNMPGMQMNDKGADVRGMQNMPGMTVPAAPSKPRN